MAKVSLRTSLRSFLERFPFAFHALREVRDSLRLDSLVPVATQEGFLLVGCSAMAGQDFEVSEQRILKELMKGVDIFVDAGANVGYFSCLAASYGCAVLAIEPMRSNLLYLMKNISLNNWEERIELYPIALGSTASIESLYGARSGASLVPRWSGGALSHEQVSVLPLDSLLTGRFQEKQLLIKVDVEGYEYRVLEGALSTLARERKPVWLVEIYLERGHGEQRNQNFTKAFNLFFEHGYACRTASGESVSPEQVQKWEVAGSCPLHQNFFFGVEKEMVAAFSQG